MGKRKQKVPAKVKSNETEAPTTKTDTPDTQSAKGQITGAAQDTNAAASVDSGPTENIAGGKTNETKAKANTEEASTVAVETQAGQAISAEGAVGVMAAGADTETVGATSLETTGDGALSEHERPPEIDGATIDSSASVSGSEVAAVNHDDEAILENITPPPSGIDDDEADLEGLLLHREPPQITGLFDLAANIHRAVMAAGMAVSCTPDEFEIGWLGDDWRHAAHEAAQLLERHPNIESDVVKTHLAKRGFETPELTRESRLAWKVFTMVLNERIAIHLEEANPQDSVVEDPDVPLKKTMLRRTGRKGSPSALGQRLAQVEKPEL